MYEKFETEIEKLNQRVEEQASERPGARLSMTHPGVGPVTALATEVSQNLTPQTSARGDVFHTHGIGRL
jgi:hypothetical protein